jgi:tetratricopeptide (TPR) repeat protein
MGVFTDLIRRSYDSHPKLLAFILLAGISVLAYANSIDNSFHFDDIPGIVRNPALRDWKNIPAYFTNPSTFGLGRTREWRPVLQISYALNYSIAALNPSVFRAFNFLFHLGTAFLIFLIVNEIGKSSPPKTPLEDRLPIYTSALFAAALFAVHTANTEAVDYIWARSSVLATFFYLGAFYFMLRGPFRSGHGKQLPWHVAGLLSFALGMGTKATAVTLPAALVLYEILFLNPAFRNPLNLFLEEPRRLKKYIPVMAVFLAYLALRTLLLPRMFTSVVAAKQVSSPSYLLTQFRAWIHYLRLFIWPQPLIVDFPGFGWSHSLWDLRVLLSLGLIMAILVLAWSVRKALPLISFFTCWFFIALLPEASFIPLANAVVGYRAYLAYAGLAVVGAMVILQASIWIWRCLGRPDEIGGSRFWLAYGSVAVVVLMALTSATIVRNRDWRDEMTLWTDVMKKDPSNPRAYMMLGAQFLDQGNYETAQEMFNSAIRLEPGNSHAYILRGYLNSRVKRNEEALSDFAMAIKLDARDPYGHFYRGELYRKTGESDKALDDYQASLKSQPFYTDAYLGMAMAYLDKEDIAKATDACRKLVEIDPNDKRGYDCLGTLLVEQNRAAEAVALYEKAVKRIPQDGELWYGLGAAYEKSGMYEQASKAFEASSRALAQPDPRVPGFGPVVD